MSSCTHGWFVFSYMMSSGCGTFLLCNVYKSLCTFVCLISKSIWEKPDKISVNVYPTEVFYSQKTCFFPCSCRTVIHLQFSWYGVPCIRLNNLDVCIYLREPTSSEENPYFNYTVGSCCMGMRFYWVSFGTSWRKLHLRTWINHRCFKNSQ